MNSKPPHHRLRANKTLTHIQNNIPPPLPRLSQCTQTLSPPPRVDDEQHNTAADVALFTKKKKRKQEKKHHFFFLHGLYELRKTRYGYGYGVLRPPSPDHHHKKRSFPGWDFHYFLSSFLLSPVEKRFDTGLCTDTLTAWLGLFALGFGHQKLGSDLFGLQHRRMLGIYCDTMGFSWA
jgi:hypothetical protein